MGDFVMPSLGADMDAGTITEWRVAPGDTVHHGDVIAVVGTDKSDIEVEVFEDGVVEEILVAPGREVPVGTPLARIGSDGAAPHAAVAPAPPSEPADPAVAHPPAAAAAAAAPVHVRSSPLARRRATELGVDLASVIGTGADGAVVAADVARAARSTRAPAAPAASTPTPNPTPTPTTATPTPTPTPTAMPGDARTARRRATGELMARSKREIPHYYLASTIDLHAALAWLGEHNRDRPVTERVLPAALLLKATGLAAAQVPALNGFWADGFQPASGVHLGVAISLRGGGLVAPAIHDVDQRSVDDLMAALGSLVERARAGRLRSSEMSDPTLTVTNLGEQGADEVFGVIYPPQVALVGFGRVVERPWAVDSMVGIRPVVRVTLAADHRASDGHEGSRLLTRIDHLLQHPGEL